MLFEAVVLRRLQRYKSLAGFAIYAEACDMPSARYTLRGVGIGIYIISHRAKRDISRLFNEHIAFCKAKYIASVRVRPDRYLIDNILL